MRIKGIVYDTGFINAGVTAKERFDSDVIKHEMDIIKNDLYCNAAILVLLFSMTTLV